jgi:hypothetical protein
MSGIKPGHRLTLPWAPGYQMPWQRPFGRRCRAVKEPNPSGYWGRCELQRGHGEAIDHALERGMEVHRWSTKWTRG